MAGAAASTHAEAAHAAMQALAAEPGEPAGTAIDGLVAGILAIAASQPSALLGAATILLGGTGEGQLVVDGRARQPGVGAQRPRGFVAGTAIPLAARVGASTLPAALVLAHAGRGERTLTSLSRIGIASAATVGHVDPERAESLRAFGRDGVRLLQAGPLRKALLAAATRSLGGALTEDDLDAARPEVITASTHELASRRWAIAPWCPLDRDDGTPRETISIVAVADARGALAIAALIVSASSLPLPGTGLSVPLLAEPVLRGVTRKDPGSVIPLTAPIAIAALGREGNGDLALGLAGASEATSFAALLRHVAEKPTPIEDAIARPRGAIEGVVCGVFHDGKSARVVKDRRA